MTLSQIEKNKRHINTHPWFSHYHNAKSRCTNPNMTQYKNYGGRGYVK